MKKSFVSSKVSLQKSRIENGLFANAKILAGELLIDFTSGPGKYITLKEANRLVNAGNDYMLQVGDDKFFAATSKVELEEADFLNHSCEPNCGIRGKLQIVAMRDIFPSEEITIDYSMSESSEYTLICRCGSDLCRKVVTGEDWKNKELQQRYAGFFSDYLKNKILPT